MNFFLFLHENINKPISAFLNSFTSNDFIKDIIFIFADAPIFLIPLFLAGYWIYFIIKKDNFNKENLLFIFYSTIVAILISLFIQQIIHIDRPETYLKNTGNLILKHIPDASFPSDHASVSTAFLLSLFLFGYRKISYFILPLFIIMLISRIAGGVHWFFDIITGVVVGTFSGFLVYKIKDFSILKNINKFILKIANFIKL
ncbi:phosphatase PAP2 family protein [Candidatus Gracilibacteria bacterium]|nr:phosphatase PAP2 family protein [Candidatus Gracilibacteria bacterium]